MQTPYRWLPKEDSVLRNNQGATDVRLAELLMEAGFSRTTNAIKERRQRLSLVDNRAAWTPECMATLEKLYGEGWSGSQIARALNEEYGTAYSRNAIIGKTNRLGLITPETTAARGFIKHIEAKVRRPKPPKPVPAARLQWGSGSVVPMVPKARPVKVTGPLPGSLNLPMWHPDFTGCRYATSPDEAETTLFCCLPVEDDGPYCGSHAACCFQPMPAKGPKSGKELVRSLRRFCA